MGKTILGLLLGVSLCCGSAQAQYGTTKTKITGAFGLNFYDKLDPNIVETGEGCAYKTSRSKEYKNWVKVRPLISNKMFPCYYVKTTPKSKKIIEIKAIGHKLEGRKRCHHNLRLLRAALTKKYGGTMERDWFDAKTASRVRCNCEEVPSKDSFLNYTSLETFLVVHYAIIESKSRKLINQELFGKDQLDSSGL